MKTYHYFLSIAVKSPITDKTRFDTVAIGAPEPITAIEQINAVRQMISQQLGGEVAVLAYELLRVEEKVDEKTSVVLAP